MHYFAIAVTMLTIVPTVYGYIIYDRLDKGLRSLQLYFVVAVIYTALAYVLTIMYNNNLWLLDLFLPFQTAMIMYTFSLWHSNERVRRIMRISILIFAGIWLVENILHWIPVELTQVSRPLSALMYVLASGVTIYDQDRSETMELTENPVFWIGCGFLIYYSFMFMIYLGGPYFAQNYPKWFSMAWIYCMPIFSILSNVFFIRGQYCQLQFFKLQPINQPTVR